MAKESGSGWGLEFRGVSSGLGVGEREEARCWRTEPPSGYRRKAVRPGSSRSSEEAEEGLPERKEGPGRGEPGPWSVLLVAGEVGSNMCGAWQEGFGLGAPKPQPAFWPVGRLALPAWLHLPFELVWLCSPRAQAPFPGEAPELQCGLPAASLVSGCDINYPE